MGRTIKFRGKSLIGLGWVFGYLEYCRKKGGRAVIYSYYDNGSYRGQNTVEYNTVGQFSGLCDRDGTEIYEGDILEWERDGRKYVVKFWDGMFYASVEKYNQGIYGGFPLHVLTHSEEGFGCKIIGNIHDDSKPTN